MPRLDQLEKMLAQSPRDPFLLYGIAMEHKKEGRPRDALSFLARTLDADPNYVYAYYQQGQIHEALGDPAAARTAYESGIRTANTTGDAHALSELTAALDML